MKKDSTSQLSAENVCRILLKKGLISKEQRQEIFKQKDILRQKLEKLQVIRVTWEQI
ncbi:MAG: hypothetical protein H8D67_32270 [Deltaproteobacteria bacterium]|nr:hypothetical protein [Deltaproteobacteria bacterium]